MSVEAEKAVMQQCYETNMHLVEISNQFSSILQKLDTICPENGYNEVLEDIRATLVIDMKKKFYDLADNFKNFYWKTKWEMDIKQYNKMLEERVAELENENQELERQIKNNERW